MFKYLAIILGISLMASPGCADSQGLSGLFPEEVRGWKAEEPDGLYDSETLYEYIDGGAEVYRALNVRAVCARRYVKEEGAEIIADLFDMGSPSDAFGAFHHDLREGRPAGIGQESELADGALAFWKGSYFVSIIATDEIPEMDDVMLELGERVAEAITEEGAPPDILDLLPERGMIPGSLRYFHNHASLGTYYPLAGGNILNLDRRTECMLGRYQPALSDRDDGSQYVLLLVRYASESSASKGLNGLQGAHLGEAAADGTVRTDEGAWAGARADERLLIAVFEAPSKAEVEHIIQEVLRRRGGGREGP